MSHEQTLIVFERPSVTNKDITLQWIHECASFQDMEPRKIKPPDSRQDGPGAVAASGCHPHTRFNLKMKSETHSTRYHAYRQGPGLSQRSRYISYIICSFISGMMWEVFMEFGTLDKINTQNNYCSRVTVQNLIQVLFFYINYPVKKLFWQF
jgi:hypothetical protein